MGWLDGAWVGRVAVMVDATATSPAANRDVEVTIPKTSAFWDLVDSSGYQIQATAADGLTPIDWGRVSWTVASRTGRIKILGASGTATWSTGLANANSLIWLYVGNPDVISDGASATATSSPLEGYVSSQAPRDVIQMTPDQPGRTAPLQRVSIKTTEARHLWFDISDRLGKARQPYASHEDLEELRYVKVTGLDDGGAATVAQPANTRFVYDNGTYIRVTLDGSSLSSGDDVTLLVTATTSSPDGGGNAQTIEQRVLVQVRDVDDQA
jgi:hypothetical protein